MLNQNHIVGLNKLNFLNIEISISFNVLYLFDDLNFNFCFTSLVSLSFINCSLILVFASCKLHYMFPIVISFLIFLTFFLFSSSFAFCLLLNFWRISRQKCENTFCYLICVSSVLFGWVILSEGNPRKELSSHKVN